MEGLNAFNMLYGMVVEDQKENGEAFDEALLKYYEERKNKKRWKPANEGCGKRRQLKLSDDLAGLMAEALGSEDEDEEEDYDGSMEQVWVTSSWITY